MVICGSYFSGCYLTVRAPVKGLRGASGGGLAHRPGRCRSGRPDVGRPRPAAPLMGRWQRSPVRSEAPTLFPVCPMRPNDRFTVDLPGLAGVPLAPLGRTLPEHHFTWEGGKRLLHYPHIDWAAGWADQDDATGGEIVYPVYYSLMHELLTAECPPDGTVRFGRYGLLKSIGWESRGMNSSGGALIKPSGRHYRQLEKALQALATTTFHGGGERLPRRILSGYRILGDPERSVAVFSPWFVGAFAGAEKSLVRVEVEKTTRLSTSSALAVYRLLLWMQLSGINEVPVEEFLSRIGAIPAWSRERAAKRIVDRACPELMDAGVLAARPTWEQRNGIFVLGFDLAGDAGTMKRLTHDELVGRVATILRSHGYLVSADITAGRGGGAVDSASRKGRVDVHARRGDSPPVAIEVLHRSHTRANYDRALGNLQEVARAEPGARLFVMARPEHWGGVRKWSGVHRSGRTMIPNIFLVRPDLTSLDRSLEACMSLSGALERQGEGL